MTLLRTMPTDLVDVVFLSGGQSEEETTLNLNAMNQLRGRILDLSEEVPEHRPCDKVEFKGEALMQVRSLQLLQRKSTAATVARKQKEDEECLNFS